MNAPLANAAFRAINAALSPITVEMICSNLSNGRHTLSALENAYNMPRETEINTAIRWLDRLIKSHVSLRQAGHPSYDSLHLNNLVDHKHALGLGLLMRSAR